MECASDTGTIQSSNRLENNTHYTLHRIYDMRKKAAINESVYAILHQALRIILTEETLSTLSTVHSKLPRFLPSYNLRNAQAALEERLVDTEYLKSSKLKPVNVPLDGDCFFTSLACYLQQCFISPESDQHFLQHLSSLNFLVLRLWRRI